MKFFTSKRVAQAMEDMFERHFLKFSEDYFFNFNKTGMILIKDQSAFELVKIDSPEFYFFHEQEINYPFQKHPDRGVYKAVGINGEFYAPKPILISEISDGYHTFDELYEFRKLYNAALFNKWAEDTGYSYNVKPTETLGQVEIVGNPVPYVKYNVHKSWKHHDGELCFGGGWFIVVAMLPTGQISNHYKAENWDLFQIPEVEKAKYPFDGHTPQDVITRLKQLQHVR